MTQNPYREGFWDGTSKEVERDDIHHGWADGYAGGLVRSCRSSAYTQGMQEGKSKRLEEAAPVVAL